MLTRDRIGALLLLAFSLGYGAMIFNIPLLPFQANQAFTARTLPQALTVLGVVLSLALLFKPLREADRAADARWRETMARLLRRVPDHGFPLGKVLMLCVLMVIYGLTVRPFGFLLATSVFLIGGMTVLGERRWGMVVATSVAVVVFFWTLMTQFLGVYIAPLPDILGFGR
ncbi:tripartite tricarboxylate transporter TctB family protein [Stappia sp.]|uniref:tripartite tricarboxylate transporter TctB family protein n=1 Tax=Stappia sp. TaxID=1870903 RepID=UPI0032D91263